MKEYSFQMTKEEVRELCLRAMWELLLLQPFKCLMILAIVVLEGILASWILALALVIMLVVLFGLGTLRRNSVMQEQLCGKSQTMKVEEGMLKQDLEEGLHCEIQCSSITKVRVTRHLLMLGLHQASKVIAWYAVPLRVFADEQERDRFVEAVRNPQMAEGPETSSGEAYEAPEAEKPEQEYFCISAQVGEEEWVRGMAIATEVIRSGTLGEQKSRVGRIVLAAVLAVFSCGAAYFFPGAAAIIHIASLLVMMICLVLLRNFLENPEKSMREQLRRGRMQNNVLGVWETSVTEAGIRQVIAEKNSVMMPWESLFCVVETDNELLFYQKDKRHFSMLLKAGAESREQLESLKELCREKQVEVLAGKRKKYVPGWFFSLLTAVVMAGYLLLILHDFRRDTDPVYISFDEQVSVLRSLGFVIPGELEEDLYAYMEENEMALYVEQHPYTWLLINLVWADEGTDRPQDGVEVFWFDFEGWDICTDYIRILEGMQELSAGSILDDVENIREDTEDIDWEKGAGTITVFLDWKGQEHSWKMDVENDWIDAEVLGIYNGLLAKEGISERFYVTGDDGQGVFVFYCTGEWAAEFEYATGLDVENYRVKKGW